MAVKQKEIKSFLSKHKIFAADTMLFIYHFEDHAQYAPVTDLLFESWESGRF